MVCILIITLLFIAGINWYIEKNIYNPLTIFSGMWCLIIFLANLKLYGMYDFSSKPLIIVGIGVLGFSLGYWGIKYSIFNKKYMYELDCDRTSDKYEFNYKIIYIFQIVCFLFYIWFSIQIIKKLNTGISYSMIRSMYQGYSEELLISSKLANFIKSWIAVPVVYTSIPIILISIFEKKTKKTLVILCIINIFMHIFCSASRFVMQYLIFESILLLLIYKKKVSRKIKNYIKSIILIAIMVIISITFIRHKASTTISDESIFKSIYSYISLCIPLFDRWISIIDSFGLKTYGMASISGVYSIINLFVLKRIGIVTPIYDYTYSIISSTEVFMNIFEGKKYNAFVTIFYYFYLDFRMIGVLLGGILFGIIYSISFTRIMKNRNIFNLLIFLLLSQGLVKSMVRLEFIMASYVMAFFYSILFIKKSIK